MKLLVLALLLAFTCVGHSQTLTVPQTSHKRCMKEQVFESCYEIADLYQNTNVAGDLHLGNQYVLYGCKLEYKRKCSLKEANRRKALYLAAEKKWHEYKNQALADMVTLKTKDELKCLEGDGEACQKAGIYYFVIATIRNPKKGEALFKEGCSLGNQQSCESLNMIKNGTMKVFDVEI